MHSARDRVHACIRHKELLIFKCLLRLANSHGRIVGFLQSLWVERTTLTLVQSLPGISRWFEVEKRELVSVSRNMKTTHSHRSTASPYLSIDPSHYIEQYLCLQFGATRNIIPSIG